MITKNEYELYIKHYEIPYHSLEVKFHQEKL